MWEVGQEALSPHHREEDNTKGSLSVSVLILHCGVLCVCPSKGTTTGVRRATGRVRGQLTCSVHSLGPQVFTSCIDLLYPTEDRNDRLRDSYFFTCECQECTTKDKVSSLRSLTAKALAVRCVSGPLCQTGFPM